MKKSALSVLAGVSALALAACTGGETDAPVEEDAMVSEAETVEEAAVEAVEEVEEEASEAAETIDENSDPTSNPIGPG